MNKVAHFVIALFLEPSTETETKQRVFKLIDFWTDKSIDVHKVSVARLIDLKRAADDAEDSDNNSDEDSDWD